MREPYLGVAVGKKGVGKSYTTERMIQKYVQGNPSMGVAPRRVLIMDVNDEYSNYRAINLRDIPRFSMHRKIEVRRIRPFKTNGIKMTLDEIAATLFKILQTYRGGMLLVEDINKYVSDNLPNDLIGALCTNRHTDTDIIMHFQGIGRITPKIWQNLNWLRFHKNTESVDRHYKKFEDKHTLLKLVELMVNYEFYQQKNSYYFVYVDIDNEKIVGNYNKASLDHALNEILSTNYKKLVEPILNKKGLATGKKYTPQEAAQEARQQLLATYVQ